MLNKNDFFIFIVFVFSFAFVQSNEKNVSVSIKSYQKAYPTHAPITLLLTVKNNLQKKVDFAISDTGIDLGYTYQSLDSFEENLVNVRINGTSGKNRLFNIISKYRSDHEVIGEEELSIPTPSKRVVIDAGSSKSWLFSTYTYAIKKGDYKCVINSPGFEYRVDGVKHIVDYTKNLRVKILGDNALMKSCGIDTGNIKTSLVTDDIYSSIEKEGKRVSIMLPLKNKLGINQFVQTRSINHQHIFEAVAQPLEPKGRLKLIKVGKNFQPIYLEKFGDPNVKNDLDDDKKKFELVHIYIFDERISHNEKLKNSKQRIVLRRFISKSWAEFGPKLYSKLGKPEYFHDAIFYENMFFHKNIIKSPYAIEFNSPSIESQKILWVACTMDLIYDENGDLVDVKLQNDD